MIGFATGLVLTTPKGKEYLKKMSNKSAEEVKNLFSSGIKIVKDYVSPTETTEPTPQNA